MKTLALSVALVTFAVAMAAAPGVTVKAVAGKAKAGQAPVTVAITIPEGYHIYGPAEKSGVSTSIKVKGTNVKVAKATFPKTKTISVVGTKFQVYEEKVSIPVVLKPTKKLKGVQKVTLLVTSQACNDRICLPPDTKSIDVNVNFGN